MKIEEIIVNNCIPIYWLETNKFKSNIIGFSFVLPLVKNDLPELTILAQLFTKYTKSFHTERELSKHLNNLFDSQIFYNFEKKGAALQITIFLHIVSENYLDNPNKLLEKAIQLFKEIVFDKKIITNEILEKEKKIYIESIESKSSTSYYVAAKSLIETMFEHENFICTLDSTIEEVNNISLESVELAYQKLLNASKFGFVIGDLNKNTVESLFDDIKLNNLEIPPIIDNEDVGLVSVKEKKINMELSQSTLLMGYRTNIRLDSKNYYSLCLLNRILGGYFNSLLNQIIREKYNLVYQIGTDYDWYKGYLLVSAGINYQDYNKVVNLVELIIDDIRNGKVSSDLFETIKNQMINDQFDLYDSLLNLIEVVYQKALYGRKTISNQEKIERIKKISIGDVIVAANELKLDTIVLVGKEYKNDNK